MRTLKRAFFAALVACLVCGSASLASAQGVSVASKGIPVSFLKTVAPRTAHASDVAAAFGPVKRLQFGYDGNGPRSPGTVGLPGVDSLTNFSDQFTAPGFDGNGNPQFVWPYTMVGLPPERDQPTRFDAPIVPVEVDLLGPDGNVATFNGQALSFGDTPDIINAVTNSPLFEPYVYPAGIGQFDDLMMRTQFWNRISHADGVNSGDGYHNTLIPEVKTSRRMQIPFGFWFFFRDPNTNKPLGALVDFNTFANALFPTTVPVDNTTPVGAAEVAGDITTRDISTFLFNQVFLYEGNLSGCCVLGFHTYDFEPGDASNGNRERRFVVNYSSWSTPGLGVNPDILVMSHEVSEIFDNPFVSNATPWWLSTDPFGIGFPICQNNLETGDAAENQSVDTSYSAALAGRTYHPQNEALLSWFAFQSPSSAFHGAYSFPDETTLLALSPANLLPGCLPGP